MWGVNQAGADTNQQAAAPNTVGRNLILAALGYCTLSSLTLPLMSGVWLGELPLLALIQLPKIAVANWLRVHVVMKAMKPLGLSRGNFSPDYVFARPYALAIVYLVTLILFCVFTVPRFRQLTLKYRALFFASFILAGFDYFLTLEFGRTRLLSLY